MVVSAARTNSEDLLLLASAGDGSMHQHTHDYLTLLSESTTTHAGMQKHIFGMMASGISKANKLQNLIINPMGSLQDAIADSASELLLRQFPVPVADASSSAAGEQMAEKEQTAKPHSHWGKVI